MDFLITFFDKYGILLAEGTWDTIVMTVVATLGAYIIGIPLGVLLVVTAPGGLRPHKVLNAILGWIVNIGGPSPSSSCWWRSIRSPAGWWARLWACPGAIVPLIVASAPFVGRMVEQSLAEVDAGLVEAAQSFGASVWQIVVKVFLRESPAVAYPRRFHHVHHAVRLLRHGGHRRRGRLGRHRHPLWLPTLPRRCDDRRRHPVRGLGADLPKRR